MRKLLVVLPMLLALISGCDSTRRDFTYCDIKYPECNKGFTCNLTTGMCVPDTGAGIPDAPIADAATGPETSPVDVSVADSKDAPVATDTTPMDTITADTAVVDAPQIVDAAIPDTRIPDAAGTCSVDNDCVGVPAGAYCVNTKCVSCRTSSQCNNDAGVPFCSAQNTCVSCAGVSGPDGGSACPASAPVCAASGGCVQCVQNSDCQSPIAAFCVQNQCVGCNAPGATASAPVSGSSDGGSVDSGARDAGAASGPCTGPTPVCAKDGTIAGQCVQCVTSADCSGTTPICNTTTNTCAACTSDTQCADKGVGPGVCMFHQDSRCASDTETIYVKNSTGCTGGTGTAASPYCQPQAGVNAVTTSKRVVVMMGTGSLGVWIGSFSGSQVSIVGQNSATISPGGADIGIHIASGNAYVRGLTVQGVGASATNPGIVVEAGATLALDRCIVKANAGGLSVNPGANFDVANSVFDNNQQGLFGTTTLFGGIYLGGSAPSAGLHRLWFNTIVNNQGIGVVCNETTQALTGMLLYGNIGGDYLSCAMDVTSKWSSGKPIPISGSSDTNPPALSSTDHLTSTSPCRGYVNGAVAHPPDDIDGDPRPKITPTNPSTKLDCGADEY